MTPKEAKSKLTQAIVHELLLYDPFLGTLTWRRRKRRWFKSDRDWKIWNKLFADKPALKGRHGKGRNILGEGPYFPHRLIWFWMTGSWPKDQIDHRNRKPDDNRWSNLREATSQENNRNRSMSTCNKSGRVGVYKSRSGLYLANIFVNDVSYPLGTFNTFLEATEARRAAERQFGYSKGHGRVQLHRDKNPRQRDGGQGRARAKFR